MANSRSLATPLLLQRVCDRRIESPENDPAGNDQDSGDVNRNGPDGLSKAQIGSTVDMSVDDDMSRDDPEQIQEQISSDHGSDNDTFIPRRSSRLRKKKQEL
ncbi:hypothetical protein QAD02_019168 [Eretmocerus hayati]|uniref:Uncharacterized protein n=1 Tax=Eretmocerus hayati TaxID=131215 RepID=A0ACC2PIU5_9HYME|nr:hypothetical protein QAD02_019168 [Eretmocerus hayati]